MPQHGYATGCIVTGLFILMRMKRIKSLVTIQIRLNNIESMYFQLIDSYLPEAILRFLHHWKAATPLCYIFNMEKGFRISDTVHLEELC